MQLRPLSFKSRDIKAQARQSGRTVSLKALLASAAILLLYPVWAAHPALIVTPPPGLEVGYVPIVTRQAAQE